MTLESRLRVFVNPIGLDEDKSSLINIF